LWKLRGPVAGDQAGGAHLAQSLGMHRASVSADDLLLAQLQAPPDLDEGIRSLAYWRKRRQKLSWYRFRARREATRMMLRWERRVHSAVLSQPGVPVGIRLSGAMLLARIRLWRWTRRALMAVTAVVGVALMLAPLAGVVVLGTRLF
jgi:hypothetical protein